MSQEPVLEGYRECHVCSVVDKMEARQCFQCTGRLDLKDKLLLESEKRWRRERSPILSAIIPGLGHWYSGRRYIGTYLFAMAPLSIGLVLATYQKWSWGLSILEMFVGEVTWMGGEAAPEALSAYQEGGATREGVPAMPAGLVSLLGECFAAGPGQRPSDIEALWEQITASFREETGRRYSRRLPRETELQADGQNNR